MWTWGCDFWISRITRKKCSSYLCRGILFSLFLCVCSLKISKWWEMRRVKLASEERKTAWTRSCEEHRAFWCRMNEQEEWTKRQTSEIILGTQLVLYILDLSRCTLKDPLCRQWMPGTEFFIFLRALTDEVNITQYPTIQTRRQNQKNRRGQL